MTHGDDAGLRLPPKVAPVQVIIVIVKRHPDVTAAAETLEQELAQTGLRVRIDDRTDLGLGRRLTDWELKGVPVRVEIGPRELAQGTVSIARRDGSGREPVKLGDAATAAREGVRRVNGAGLSVRCLTTADGSVPATADAGDLYAIVARAY